MLALAVCATVPWVDALIPAVRDALGTWHEDRRSLMAGGAARSSGTSDGGLGRRDSRGSVGSAGADAAAPSVARWLFEALSVATVSGLAAPLLPGPGAHPADDWVARCAARG